MDDPFHLSRFLNAQAGDFAQRWPKSKEAGK